MADETFTPDNLLAGSDFPAVTAAGTLVTGQNLKRGAVLSVITATGKLTLCNKAAVDGSQTAVHVLAVDCDATAADKPCVVYETGIFNPAALTLAAGTTTDDVKAALRSRSIFLRAMNNL
jgi:hypothetical protein